MTSLLISTIFQLTVLASAHGLRLKTAGRLRSCGYPFICQDNCKRDIGDTHCAGPSQDCPCIIKACWTLNGSCIHACDGMLLAACLGCLNSSADNMCDAECSGVCVDAKCEHSQGECQGCVPGMYGQSCGQICSAVCNGSCYRDTGYCRHCQHRTHGPTCQHTCPDRCHTCSAQNGSCLRCAEGYTGRNCNTPCPGGFYGSHCGRKCPKNCARTCDHVSGSCIGGCKPGYYRADCMKTCPPGTYGQDCASECAVTCAKTMVCHHINGSCTDGCSSGFRGQQCGVLCSLGTFGPNCSQNCSQNCFFGVCNRFSGHCQRCDDGRAGLFCEYVTRVGHSRTNINDDNMSTDQTILIFLGLFAMGGAMWFLLGTFVYYKQKIIMKKAQETGQLPKDWTSILRRYPQYFYNPRLLSRSTDLRGAAGPVYRARSLQRRERKRVVKLNLNPGQEFTRQLRQGHLRNVQMEGQKKDVQMEGLRLGKNVHLDGRQKHVQREAQGKNVEIKGQGKTAQREGQRKTHTVESIENNLAPKKNMGEDRTGSLFKTRRQSFSQLYSPDLLPDRNLDVERGQVTSARRQVYVGKRRMDDGELSTMFEVEEDPIQEHVEGKPGTVSKDAPRDDKAESTNSITARLVRVNPATTLEGVPDGAGDTKSSTRFDMTGSTTTGLESRSVLAALGETRSPYMAPGQRVAQEVLRKDVQSKRRTPQQDKKSLVDGARTSDTTIACPMCGKQCLCSLECQCSVVSTATTQEGGVPAVLLRRARSSVLHQNVSKADKLLLAQHGLSHTSSSYVNVKPAAVHTRGSRKDRGLFKPPRPVAQANQPRDQMLSTSRQRVESSLDAPRIETSLAGDTEGELSDTGTSTSGTTTHQTSKMKTETSVVTASDSEVTESMSTTIESSAITETSGKSASSAGNSWSERQHRYFQAALERQSQPYTAKTDTVPPFGEENPRAENSQYDYKQNKPLGFFQRSIRNVVGAFNKLMGGEVQPQEVMSTRIGAADAYRTFNPNERLSPQFLPHIREPQRPERDASVKPQPRVTKITARRQKRASSRADKVSAADKEGEAESVTEQSSAMSNTAGTSSRSGKEDTTLTDASEIEYSTVSSSEDESASTTLRSSEASSSAASTSSGTTVESTEKHTSTDVDSIAAATRSTSHKKSGHPRSNRPKYRQESFTRRKSSHSRSHRPTK